MLYYNDILYYTMNLPCCGPPPRLDQRRWDTSPYRNAHRLSLMIVVITIMILITMIAVTKSILTTYTMI